MGGSLTFSLFLHTLVKQSNKNIMTAYDSIFGEVTLRYALDANLVEGVDVYVDNDYIGFIPDVDEDYFEENENELEDWLNENI